MLKVYSLFHLLNLKYIYPYIFLIFVSISRDWGVEQNFSIPLSRKHFDLGIIFHTSQLDAEDLSTSEG